MQKTYHIHYTNHANTVAHLQHKNAELNKALVIVKPSVQKSLDFYGPDHDRHHRHHRHHHHHRHRHERQDEDDGSYDNGDFLSDEDCSLDSKAIVLPSSETHVPLLPIPQHRYSFVSNEMKSVTMEHPPYIPPQEPPHPIHPPYIPPQEPPHPTPPAILSAIQTRIPQKRRMSLVL